MEYSEDHPDTWTRVDRLFTKALDLAPERRAAFLQAECGDDEALYTEVISLLDAAVEMDEGFLGTPALPLTEESGELTAGLRIGPYRVIEEIGRGGMGKIFSAVRADAVYEQRVAIKILKRGLDTDEIVRRFRSERRLLALLDHPNIVRILDGGTTENGLPYFVMEYVEGQTIDRYCADRELSLRERLALFREVCAAVGFAHQNLVIHRDLKPQNIL
ncbi:MAG: serine/threonine-protein kinase, partial [Acidobacteriota bacterium]